MSAVAGAATVARLILRRDRFLLPVWIVVLGLLPVGVGAAGSDAAYPAAADKIRFAASVVAPATVALRGQVLSPTTGGLATWTTGSSVALLATLVSVLTVVRHTRTEEQNGRAELLGSGVLGRYASLAAALGVVAAGNAALALLVAGSMVAYGLPLSGSVALAVGFLGVGVVFAVVAAVAVQVAADAGTARSIAFVLLGLLFALAAAAELGRPGLAWATPFGWARRIAPFAGDRWWVLAPFVATVVVVGGIAVLLAGRRDLGAGLVPPRPGPAAGRLHGTLGLAWRLHRGWIAGWALGALVLGALIGAVAATAGSLLDTPTLRAVFGDGDPVQAFLQTLLFVLAQVVTVGVVAAALRVRGQEAAGLADVVLALPVARARWAGGHLLFAAVGALTVLAALGIGAGLASGTPLFAFGAALAYAPACVVFAGLALAATGWIPRAAAALTWAVLAVAVALDFLAEFRLAGPEITRLSPFASTSTGLASGNGITATLLVLVVVAAALAATGVAGLRRRDLVPG